MRDSSAIIGPMVTGRAKKSMTDSVATIIVRDLSEAERRGLRVAAAMEDLSTNKLVLRILREWLARRNGKK